MTEKVNIVVDVKTAKATKQLKTAGKAGQLAAKKIEVGFNSTTSALKVMQGVLGAGALIGTFNRLKDAGIGAFSAMVDEASRLENATQTFSTLLGSDEGAIKLINDLRDAAAKTPFEIAGLQEATKDILQMGVHVDDAVPLLMKLGDAAAVGSGDIKGLAAAFKKASTIGVVQAETFETITNHAPVLAEALVKAAGVSGVGALRKAMEEGEVTAQTLSKALDIATSKGGKAFKGMDKQSSTLTGRLSNLSDTFVNLAGDLGKVLLPQLELAVSNVIRLVQENEKLIKQFAKKNLLDPIVSGLKSFNKIADSLTKKEISGIFLNISNALETMRDAVSSTKDALEGFGKRILNFAFYSTLFGVAIKAWNFGSLIFPPLIDFLTALVTKLKFIPNLLTKVGGGILKLGEAFVWMKGLLARAATFVGTYSVALTQLAKVVGSSAGIIISALWSEGLNDGEDAIIAMNIAAANSQIPLRNMNDEILEQIGLLDILNGKAPDDSPIMMRGVVSAEEVEETTPKDSGKNEAERRRKEKLYLDLQALKSDHIVKIREMDTIAQEEEAITAEMLKENNLAGYVALHESRNQIYLDALQREHTNRKGKIKDERRYQKERYALIQKQAAMEIANKKSADSQLVAMERQKNAAIISGAFGLAGTIAGVMGGSAKKQFMIQQGLAMAQATVAAYTAESLALASPPGPPWTIPVAAAAFAKGMVNVGMIGATTFVQGAFGKFATGGVVGPQGQNLTGDNLLIRSNAKEMMLNMDDQVNLHKAIKEGDLGGNNDAVLAMANRPIIVEVDGHAIASVVRDQIADGFVLEAS